MVKGHRIRELMHGRNMALKSLAAAVGVSVSQMCNVLMGRRRLNLLHSKRLINLFGAEAISKAIDWESMNIREPLEV